MFTGLFTLSMRANTMGLIQTASKYSFAKRAGKIFADPTYDNTFKMLCANEEHPEITRSILNSFLDLEGENEIVKVSSITKEKLGKNIGEDGDIAYISSNSLKNSTINTVDSSVDLLCTTKNGKQVAIEMQRAHEDYFLARSQLYMSKLIASQVESGQSARAHEVMLDTYIICIGRSNIITDPTIAQKQKEYLKAQEMSELSFTLTVTPRIHHLNMTIEGNKMTWKFFELSKFKEFSKHVTIDKKSPIKYQWMKFLLKCQDADNTPEDIADIIKEGYKIMEMANWTPEQKMLYDMEINQEELTLSKIEKATGKGKFEGMAIAIKKVIEYGGTDEKLLNDKDLADAKLNTKKLALIRELPQPPESDKILQILSDDYTDENLCYASMAGEDNQDSLIEH